MTHSEVSSAWLVTVLSGGKLALKWTKIFQLGQKFSVRGKINQNIHSESCIRANGVETPA